MPAQISRFYFSYPKRTCYLLSKKTRTFVGDRIKYEAELSDGVTVHAEEPYRVGMMLYNEGDPVKLTISPADALALPD